MKNLSLFLFCAIFLFAKCQNSQSPKTENKKDSSGCVTFRTDTACSQIVFQTKDSLFLKTDIYYSGKNENPTIILCHQAGYSRGEYVEIGKILAKKGFNCIAIDQRSGNEVNGVKNITAQQFLERKKQLNDTKPVEYLDAEPDIEDAIYFGCKFFGKEKRKVILWGSSYSASLCLKIAAKNDDVMAVLAFSPGEYFGNKLTLKNEIKNFNKPLFVTSSKSEAADLTKLVSDIKNKTQFIPDFEGKHGSSCLWSDTPNNEKYWKAVDEFLKKRKKH